MAPPDTVIDTDALKITCEAGSSGIAIVSFTGIGLEFGGVQIEEFAGTMDSQDGKHAVFYVIDKERSWFNRTHSDVVRHLTPRLRYFDKVVTLGNSMGGFGALYFGGLLPNCRRAIAFSPQYSMAPGVPEKRWNEWRSRIDDWHVNHALETLTSSTPAIVLFGDGAPDHWHREKFRENLAPPHSLIVVQETGHNVIRTIKESGALAEFIGKAISDASEEELRAALIAAGLQLR